MPFYLDYLLNGVSFSTLDELKQQLIVPEGEQIDVGNPDDYIIAHEKYLQTFIFFGYSNIETYAQDVADDLMGSLSGDLFDSIKDAVENNKNIQVIEPENKTEEVSVPNTAFYLNKYIYIIGAIVILSGLIVIGIVLKKKKNFTK